MFTFIKLFIREFFINIIEILFPEFCVGCGKLNTLLCNKCYETLEFVQFKIEAQNICKKLDSITCCCYYDKISKNLIHQLKYNGVINIGQVIAHIIYYNSNLPKYDLITFVPMHKKKTKLRGFNQAKVIALKLGKLTKTPVAELLIKTKNTKSQMSLGKKSNRQKNISNSIEINNKIDKLAIKKYKSILIVDDVFTTGTTLNYCAKILKNCGFKEIHGSVYAN